MSNIENPHDKFFRQSISHRETAQSFIENYLPQNILQELDLASLAVEKDSYIDQELAEYFSDTVYKATIAGQESYLCFLFEHKSYPYPQITLQLLKYMLKIWELKAKQQEQDKLPVIIPILIYHSQREWNIGLRLSDIMAEVPPELELYMPDFEYLFYDISAHSKEEIKGQGGLRVFLEILRSLTYDNLTDSLKRIEEAFRVLDELERENRAIDYFETVIKYLLDAQEDMGLEDLRKTAGKISAGKEEEVMTIAEKLKEEGREEGRKEGREEGMVEVVEEQLLNKFKSLPNKYKERLRKQDETNLRTIAVKILEIKRLEDLEKYLN